MAGERWRGRCCLAAALVLLLPAVRGQAGELTRGDRLAILYSPQLRFSADREPLIRVGLMDAAAEVRLTANTPVQIDPMGDGGLAVDVPANTALTVRIRGGEPGRYSYAVVVSSCRPIRSEVPSGWFPNGRGSAGMRRCCRLARCSRSMDSGSIPESC